jgi:membrane fusion protein, multidrug efflux system
MNVIGISSLIRLVNQPFMKQINDRNKAGLFLMLFAILNFTACTSDHEEKNEDGKFAITSPLLMDTSITKEYVAQIQSLQNVEIHAMVKGYIQAIHVDEGQQVKAGQVLFNILPKEYEAELQKVKAEAKTREIEWQNTKALAEKNIVSNTELVMAQAKLDEAKAELAKAELYVSWTEIKAPFNGVIDRIRFKVGSLIDEGTLLTTISNNQEIYAYFNVSEVEYLNFKANSKSKEQNNVTLLLANNQVHKYKGTIETIEGEFDNETGNIAFRAKFPNPDWLLKHGETGKIQLTVEMKNVIAIPQKATYEIQDQEYVYVVDKNNVLQSKGVKIKQKLPNLYILENGLSVNDKILLEGIQQVKDDQKIEIEFMSPKQVIAALQLIKQ